MTRPGWWQLLHVSAWAPGGILAPGGIGFGYVLVATITSCLTPDSFACTSAAAPSPM